MQDDCKLIEFGSNAGNPTYVEAEVLTDGHIGVDEWEGDPRKLAVREAKSAPCTDCGGVFPVYVMDLDHVVGPKRFNLSQATSGWSLEEVLEEIAKCEPVCANCHRERTFGDNHHPRTLIQNSKPPRTRRLSPVVKRGLKQHHVVVTEEPSLEGPIRNYRGVYPASFGSAWRSYIRHEGELKYLGTYDTELEAAAAYDRAAAALRGPKAKLNLSEVVGEDGQGEPSEPPHHHPSGDD